MVTPLLSRVRATPGQLEFLARNGCDLSGCSTPEEKTAKFKDWLYSTPAGPGFRFAELNPALENAGVYVNDLHVSQGGNSFRKAGAVSGSKLINAMYFG